MDGIWSSLGVYLHSLWLPFSEWLILGKWYLIGAGIILLMFVIGWFWDKLRPYAGVVVAVVIAFLAGMTKMWLVMRGQRADAAREKAADAHASTKAQQAKAGEPEQGSSGGGIFGGWR